MAAALAARAGWMLDAIQKRLVDIRDQTEIFYTLDTLEYLARGGRIGRVQALAGTLLGLKPVISVDHRDGKYNTLGKTRTITQALQTISDQLFNRYSRTPVWVAILNGRFAPKAEALAQELTARLNIARLDMLRIAPVLGVHTGPGVVGAAVVPMSLLEDLL
jgi:DegV family protein with EDD domain